MSSFCRNSPLRVLLTSSYRPQPAILFWVHQNVGTLSTARLVNK